MYANVYKFRITREEDIRKLQSSVNSHGLYQHIWQSLLNLSCKMFAKQHSIKCVIQNNVLSNFKTQSPHYVNKSVNFITMSSVKAATANTLDTRRLTI